MSRQIGSVIVRENTVVSMGYNGPPRGVDHCPERYFKDPYVMAKIKELRDGYRPDMPYTEYIVKIIDEFNGQPSKCPRQFLNFPSGQGLDLCIAGHAEANAIVNAAREGVITKGCKLYLNGNIMPCHNCMILIINAGITEIVVSERITYLENATYLLNEAGIKVKEVPLLENM